MLACRAEVILSNDLCNSWFNQCFCSHLTNVLCIHWLIFFLTIASTSLRCLIYLQESVSSLSKTCFLGSLAILRQPWLTLERRQESSSKLVVCFGVYLYYHLLQQHHNFTFTVELRAATSVLHHFIFPTLIFSNPHVTPFSLTSCDHYSPGSLLVFSFFSFSLCSSSVLFELSQFKF